MGQIRRIQVIAALCVAAAPAPAQPLANPSQGLEVERPASVEPESDRPGEVAKRSAPALGPPMADAETGGAPSETESEAPPLPESERQPLGAPREAASGSRAEPGASPSSSGPLSDPTLRTVAALVLVVSLIFTLKAVMVAVAKRGGGLVGQLGPGGRAPSGVLSVLGRYPVAKGQTLVLLKLDRRVILACQSAGGFSTLCEVDDPDEVASLLSKAEDDEGASLSQKFRAALSRLERDPGIVGERYEDGSFEMPTTPRGLMQRQAQSEADIEGDGGDALGAIRARLDRLRGGGS